MSEPFVCLTSTAERSQALGEALAQCVVPLPKGGLVWDLRGPLGAGKTAFVQGIARGLQVPTGTRVVSPTYTIARSYPCGLAGVDALHHIDAYRLGGVDDLDACGFEEMCGEGLVTCVEWGGRIEAGLPEDRLLVHMLVQAVELQEDAQVVADSSAVQREIRIEATGPQAQSVMARWSEAVMARWAEVRCD